MTGSSLSVIQKRKLCIISASSMRFEYFQRDLVYVEYRILTVNVMVYFMKEISSYEKWHFF